MEADIRQDLQRLRALLKDGDVVINFECFNASEANLFAQNLTPAERARIAFRWRFTNTIPVVERRLFRRA